MTVLPGSLDYLYYQGILDHIPYEAYDMPYVGVQETSAPQISGSQMKQMVIASENGNVQGGVNNMANTVVTGRVNGRVNGGFNANNTNSMNASQYLDYAKQGMIYDAYGSGDSFIRTGNVQNPAMSTQAGGVGNGSVYDLKAQTLGVSSNQSEKGSKSESKDPIFGSSSWKGILAAALVVLTPILLIKGLKKKH